MDKNQAIIDYMLQCSGITDTPLYFNFINAKDDTKQFITVSNDVNIQRPYVDGSIQKRYQMTVIVYRSISDVPLARLPGYPSENVEDIADVQTLIDWIRTQNNSGNYPDFGDKCIIDRIYTTTDNPVLDQIDQTIQPPLARYRFTVSVDYLDNTERIF